MKIVRLQEEVPCCYYHCQRNKGVGDLVFYAQCGYNKLVVGVIWYNSR